MSSEITKRDRAHNTVPEKKPRIPYGRGSRIRLKYAEGEVTLTSPIGKFWKMLTSHGFQQVIHENQIGEILVNGSWITFTNNPREWEKVC